ncbi:MAG: hypothetical protein A2942_02290 [Candidatus Lloydbacteria bacterium RIFCSPLOWO2_01_FULL_50_20]|uniref:Uncharacterized protein n=1 Tax=Candidatus Lloydbacteria bacterium RIFCSPLOWO2_01_FULL_50_20 TaxID=1798665 RepID=A0A1G2DF26_9BACT|nr:MAG: hypothetical protein A3C13_03200 [Candidatus Lloydbacteria bacterium RIFCSPHIGHO2_02_FULL_50_11]OGZ12032.1 MAG: hypothetical protein A2942_02290 [Candidatus Lloydbacteria bacterium RIFCSPLOWO2_01_FULL_50_20]
MANSFDTSFIPQQPLLKVEGSARRFESVNIILVIAFFVFFVTLIVWGGMYFYKTSIDKRIVESEKELQSKEANLKTDEIARYKAIDERLSIAKGLLQNHVAFSTILTLLEEITAKNIGLTGLKYSVDSDNGSITLDLSAQAPSYSAVYAQVEAWREMRSILREVKVDMPRVDTVSGIVSFAAKLAIDPGYVKYARLVQVGSSATEAPGESSPQTP